jgi:hypothetical protein
MFKTKRFVVTIVLGTLLLLCSVAFAMGPTQAGIHSSAAHAANPPVPAGWTGWSEVPGGGRTSEELATTSFKSTLYLFARGTDQKIYVNTGTSWSEVPGGGRTDEGLAATSFKNTLFLFATGTDDKIYVNVLS